jgi:alkylation response protein AidB-like acyl-CoA dehydrogenase
MEFKLNEDQEMIRSLAREYAQNYLEPRVEEIESAEHFPEDLFRTMADMGFLSINLPKQYGGIELGYVATSIAVEEISKVSGSAGTVLTVALLPLDAINMYGTETQKQRYLVSGIQGDWKGSFAFTEAGTGSDPKQLVTTAVKTETGKYKLNGVKRFISNASYNGPMVVFAREAETDACTAFIIQKFCKGYSLSTSWEKVGFEGSRVYDVFLDDVEVTEEDILGEHGQGFDILIGATAYGKLAFSAVFTGLMDGAYELAKRYAQEKLHRGKPIAKFPTIQSKIAQIAANSLSAQLMLYKAAEDADTIKDIHKVQCSTALLKGYIADLAITTNVMALNIMGSYGVTREYKVERFVRDSLIGPNIEGAADIQRLIAGSYILRH